MHTAPLATVTIRGTCRKGIAEGLVAGGGGFVPQSPTDSLELTDSTMVRNAKNGYKGNFFIQFSFSFASLCRLWIQARSPLYSR
jgi:hypothetical protein